MVAAEVLPKRSMLEGTFSSGSFNAARTALLIRSLA